MQYTLAITSAAGRDLKRLSRDILERVDRAILKLRDEPRPSGYIKLCGEDDLYRVRVGDYRIIYAIDDSIQKVTIARVRHRREVYDNI